MVIRAYSMTENEILLTSVLNCKRSDLYIEQPPLSARQLEELAEKESMRSRGMPLQYILGETEFFGLNFKVDRSVFIPRPETEILVTQVLEYFSGHRADNIEILDIATGSGCIAVSLAKNLPGAKVTAVDISECALALARVNAMENGVEQSIEFIRCDLFPQQPNVYDLIIANPPYIASGDISSFPKELMYEPRIAFDAGGDGLGFYRRIIDSAINFLKQGALIMLEIGFNQSGAIKDICEAKNFHIINIVKDYNDIERVVVIGRG